MYVHILLCASYICMCIFCVRLCTIAYLIHCYLVHKMEDI